MQTYHILCESEPRSRLEVAVLRGLTPLVGREEETMLLLRRWEQAKAGEGQVVMLNGEAGIGKSRLVQVLKEQIAQTPHVRIEWRCSPYHQNSALYPVIEQVQRMLQFERDDALEEKFRKLENTLKRRGEVTSPLQETVSLLASLLSLPLPESYPPLTLTPQRQKQKTLEALLGWLLQEAARQPVIVIVEDLHWIDPSTLELLSLLIEQEASHRVLVVLTFRPDFSPPWAMASHLTRVTLSRFAPKQIEVMVENVAGGKNLPREVLQQIIAKTDGVPLFVEEMTKNVVETVGAIHESPPQLTIPATLHDSLMARLDRLNTAKEVAQLGATLGREFSYELLRAVSSVDEKNLQSSLGKLVEAELLYQRGQPPTARYTFKHALVQDAAYQSLLKSTRQQYHHRIAQVLEERFPETKETQPELLAHHYTEARLVEQAIPHWQQAGQRAIERSANIEAINHLNKGLELLNAIPETPERIQQELTLQIALGVPLQCTKGYAAPEVKRAYTRARELCQHMKEPLRLFPVLRGLSAFYIVRGEYQTARELGEQMLQLAQRVQTPALLLEAHHVLGQVLYGLGELILAHEHVEQAIALYNPQRHHSHAFLYGQDPGIACLVYGAYVLWYLGYPDRALRRNWETIKLAQELAHPFSLALAHHGAALVYYYRQEIQAVQEQAEALITLSREQGFVFREAGGTIVRGWVLVEQGRRSEGMRSAFSKPSKFPVNSRRNRWSCARR